ncbi:hypothetical protein [Psychroserpens sp. NJDZ02]|uniref:hypothetical protein n=1 Tax=Psychroserpens sp. NJDZ02 TaxID=2570561 RepID=UPI0010A78DE6|nr:hypothetical protein [Psychroserpens sp. NJDZ02]QCE40145.1 hypothetical protein E9099_01475 [Psychroserpens sp. NJDZ02]
MKNLKYILCLFIFTSCNSPKQLTFKTSKIDKVEVISRYLGKKTQMKAGFKEDFIADLNKSSTVTTEDNISTHKILIYKKNGKIDTLLTDGFLYQNKGFYKSKENLITKYSIEENNYLSDTVQGKLKTFERLQIYLKKEKHDKLASLFVNDVQWFIREIRVKDKERFKRWCVLWTFDKVAYKEYVIKIINKKDNLFDYENGEWKINQK